MRMPNNSDIAIVSPEVKEVPATATPRAPIRREDGMVNYGFGFVEPLPHDKVGRDHRTAAQIAQDEWVKPGPAILLPGGGIAHAPSLAEQHAQAARDYSDTQNAAKKNADAAYFRK
jgi:hypothetical protein